jgi:HEPN domain-containing protein
VSRIEKLIKYWKKASEKDLISAENIAENTKEYVNALFLIHLSVEKCFKCYYVYKFKMDAPFTHNLLQLVLKSEIELSADQLNLLTELNEYNIRCRYPDDNFQIYKIATKSKVKKFLVFAGELRAWIFLKLS